MPDPPAWNKRLNEIPSRWPLQATNHIPFQLGPCCRAMLRDAEGPMRLFLKAVENRIHPQQGRSLHPAVRSPRLPRACSPPLADPHWLLSSWR